MLAIIASKWYHNYGTLPKKDGTPYKTEKGAFRNHPCTIWASQSVHNAYWLIQHGLELCNEFKFRFHKPHACYLTLLEAQKIFPNGDIKQTTSFVRAMPDNFKLNRTIDTFTAYKLYILSKEWVRDDYNNAPERKPSWIY